MKYPYIDGRKCYRPMTEIKDDIDVAILALPASKVMGALKPVENVKCAIIVSAGFKEVGDSGQQLEGENFDDVNTRLTEKKSLSLQMSNISPAYGL